MNFRFKTRLFFRFFVLALFFLFFFSVVFNFSSFNNKKTPKFYNTTFKSEDSQDSYQDISEEKAKEVWKYFQLNPRLYSTLQNNGYKVIGEVNIENLPSANNLYSTLDELGQGRSQWLSEVLTTLKKLAFADVYKSFSPTNWIQVFQSYNGKHLLALLKLLDVDSLTVKDDSYNLVHLQKIDWSKQNAQKTQKLIQNIWDLGVKGVSDDDSFDSDEALDELAALVENPGVKLYDLFDAANKVLSTKTGISSEEKMKIVPVITESVASPQKMKALFDYLKKPDYYSLFWWKFSQRGIKELKIFSKKYSVTAIAEASWDKVTVSTYDQLDNPIKAELEALVKDGIDFFELISALDYRLHEMLFKAFASKENDLLAKIRKVRYLEFVTKGDDKTTRYSLVNIKKYDFNQVKSFFDIKEAAVRKEMTHLINAKFIPADFSTIFSAGYKQEVLIDKLKLPANKSKILVKMQALELDKLNIGGIEYDIETFRKIDFTKISDEFLDPANRKGPKWDQIQTLSNAGITLQEMNAALDAKLKAEENNIKSPVESVWTILQGNSLLLNIKKYKPSEIILTSGEKISLTNLYNLKEGVEGDDYNTFEPKEIATLFLLSQLNSDDLKKKIEDATLSAQRKAIEPFLTWLKDNNRLADITKYKITGIDDDQGGKTALGGLSNLQSSDTYDNLEPAEKTLLLKLSGVGDAQTQIDALIQVAKEKAKIASVLTWLKDDNRLEDIAKYNIASETVQNYDGVDVNLSELTNIKGDSTYENFLASAKSLLLKIDRTVKNQIVVLISNAEGIETILTWLKEGTRLDDIKTHTISGNEINAENGEKTALSDLSELQAGDTYDDLEPAEKTLLLKLSGISDTKTQIDTAIEKAKIDLILTWLNNNNRLDDIVKYKIADETLQDDDETDVALSELANITDKNTYGTLPTEKRKLLLKFDDSIKNAIDNSINDAKTLEKTFEWFKESNRLVDIQTHMIREIDDDQGAKTSLSDLASLQTTDTYADLEGNEKDLLLKLSKIDNVEGKIAAAIKKAKINEFLTWLKTNNRLGDIKTHTISDIEIDDDDDKKKALSDLSELQTTDTYALLEENEKDLLSSLSQISDAKTQIDALIQTAQDKVKITETLTWLQTGTRLADIVKYSSSDPLRDIKIDSTYESLLEDEKKLLLTVREEEKRLIDDLIKNSKTVESLLEWLKANNRLVDIQTYKIMEINNREEKKIALNDLSTLKTTDTFAALEVQEKTLLLTLSKISDAQNQIDALIKVAKQDKAEIDETLEWLKEPNRLKDIKIYSIPSETIQDNDRAVLKLTELTNITDKSTYALLEEKEKTLLLKLSGITNAKTQIDALIKDLKAGVDDLIKNFQKPNSILTKLKDLDKNKIKVKGKDLSFKNLLKVKVKDWKTPNAFKNMKPETRKELLNIMRSLSNNRKRIPEINSAIEKIETKEKKTENNNDQVIMWVSIGLGILLLLGVSFFAFKYFQKKSKK